MCRHYLSGLSTATLVYFGVESNKHSCPLAPDLDPDIPVLRLLSRSDSEQFKLDHRGNTLAQVGKIFYTI